MKAKAHTRASTSSSLARKGGVTANLKGHRAQHNSKKPTVRHPGTEAACAMQVTRPEQGLMLHHKACAAVGLQADCALPKHLRTLVQRPRRLHALGTGYARKSSEPLGFR